MLHTGQGAAALGLLLGLLALGVPVMGVTGTMMWLAGRRGRPRLRGNVPAAAARNDPPGRQRGRQHLGLCSDAAQGADGGGGAVHAGPMSAFDPDAIAQARADHRAGRHLWRRRCAGIRRGLPRAAGADAAGSGSTPRGAGLRRQQLPPFLRLCPRGVGCGGGEGLDQFLGLGTVDRQSPQDFARWGRALGEAMGIPLDLAHQPVLPDTPAADARVAPRLWGGGAGADRDPALCAAPHIALAAR